MTSLQSAVSWTGTDITLTMFCVWRGATAKLAEPARVTEPNKVSSYDLEDVDACFGGQIVVEIDLVFDTLPDDVEAIVRGWLEAAIAAGACFAWFAFEGTFDFDHLLMPDIADQVYGIADRHGVPVAVDDTYRASAQWRLVVADEREVLLAS